MRLPVKVTNDGGEDFTGLMRPQPLAAKAAPELPAVHNGQVLKRDAFDFLLRQGLPLGAD